MPTDDGQPCKEMAAENQEERAVAKKEEAKKSINPALERGHKSFSYNVVLHHLLSSVRPFQSLLVS